MGSWPFGTRGGLTEESFTSDDPRVCAHQAVRLKILLAEFEGKYEVTWMILSRLEIVYICAGRPEDAARVHADSLALARPAWTSDGNWIREWWHVHQVESRYRHGQWVIEQNLADLDGRAPWDSDQDVDTVRDLA